MYSTISRFLTALSKLLALIGGTLLIAIIALVVISVSGRALIWAGLGPIPGDFELVEAATALAVFCFLPWCQLERGHVSVDIFAERFGPRLNALLSVLFDLAMTVVAAFILGRLWAGMQDKLQYNETTYILQFPVWWGYAVCVPVAALFVVVCAWSVVRSLTESRTAFGAMERR